MKNVLAVSIVILSFICIAWMPKNTEISTNLEVGNIIKTSLHVEANAAIVWNKTLHDFGTITQNIPVEYEFQITNNGSEAVKILNVKTSCGCTAAGYSKEAIEPGQSTTLKASYNAKAAGLFSKNIKVFTDVQEEPYMLKIKGEVETAE